MDLRLIASTLPFFVEAAGVTLVLTCVSVLIGIAIGLAVALCRLAASPVARAIGSGYSTLLRGTPLLIQLLLIYYGLPQLGISVSPLVAGVAGLSCNTGAYIGEVIRGGIQAIDRGQMEAGFALGLSYRQVMQAIILPQAFRIIVPPLVNEFIIMLKASSLVSAISLTELTRMAWRLKQATYRPLEMYTVALIFYVLMTTVLYYVSEYVQHRMGPVPGGRNEQGGTAWT